MGRILYTFLGKPLLFFLHFPFLQIISEGNLFVHLRVWHLLLYLALDIGDYLWIGSWIPPLYLPNR